MFTHFFLLLFYFCSTSVLLPLALLLVKYRWIKGYRDFHLEFTYQWRYENQKEIA